MSNKVQLCIDPKNQGLPRSFKVFTVKDIRTNKSDTVFIDVTGIITLNDGYFSCRKIDILITYLFGALSDLLYLLEPVKLINNSNISISATECFVSLFGGILDYLRIIGYSQNKEKILYLSGLYFLHNVMGKEIDTYTKNISAKISGISSQDTKAFDLYYDINDFSNINTFITMISNTFKLKGLTTEVFCNQWLIYYGKGTHFAQELFTSFSQLIIFAYCGSYVVNQKQIERCCGSSMVKYCKDILKLGVDTFDNRGYLENSDLASLERRDSNTISLAESILNRNKVPEDAKFTADDFKSKSKAKERAKKLMAYYRSVEQESKISKKMSQNISSAMRYMNTYISKGENVYEDGVTLTLVKDSYKYLDEKDKRNLGNDIKHSCENFTESLKKNAADKEKCKRISKSLVELRKCLQYL
jgi:hypothetical protein